VRVDGGIAAYFAPGGGLGHLNRGLAICLGLREHGVDARIVTNSPFAAGLAGLARCPLVELTGVDWAGAARAFVREVKPGALITDTFPYGLRDEWRGAAPPAPLLHIARRLRTPVPLHRPDFAQIVAVEPLAPEHSLALGAYVALDGPVRLAPGRIAPPLPKALDRNGLTLVVHSGPEDEVRQLIALAEEPFAVISPWSGLDFYPAVNLYGRARRVITGAGYNSMADGLWWPGKHTAVPFPRRYDDQQARLRGFFREPLDGTAQAVDALLASL
jgi:hypothetical protein